MAFANVDVPVNGEGIEIDLSSYGFAKTFTSQGNDAFDAIIEVNVGTGFCPVGRIKGQSVEVVKAWGFNFRLRRLDDGTQGPVVTVSVQAPSSRLALVGGAGAVVVPGVDSVLALGAVQEPVTLSATAAAYGEILVLGRSGTGEEAPIGRLTNNSILNVNDLADITDVVFRLVRSEDPASGINVNTWGKAQSDAQSLFGLAKLSIVGGGLTVLSESPYAQALIDQAGIVHVAAGTWDVPFTENFPNNQPLCFFGISPAVGGVPERWTLKVAADSIAANAVRVEVFDDTGAHVDPGQINVYMMIQF